MNEIVLDSNYIVGILDEKDIWHKKAFLIKERLIHTDGKLVFLDCVINEVVSVLARRFRERKMLRSIPDYIIKLHKLVPRNSITWVYPEIERFYDKVLRTVEMTHGELNFHDALIVHFAREFGISRIVSFDKHFDERGLTRIKDAGDV